MYLNRFPYFPLSSSPPSQTAPLSPQSAYQLHPAIYPGTCSNHGYNTNWSQEVQVFLQNANQMTSGEPSAAGATATTINDSYQCRWRTGDVPCGQGFATFDELIVHQGKVHDVQGPAARKLVCQWVDNGYCGLECRRDGFRRHIGTHVGLSFPCPQCDKAFSRGDSMRAHQKRQHGKG